MRWCLCLWMVLAARAITVSGIHVNISKSVLTSPPGCQAPYPIENSNLLHVECKGLSTLQDVKKLVKQDLWKQLGSLTISNSSLTTNLTLDDLVNYTSLHTLTFRTSRLSKWRKPQIASVPKITKLVVELCWDDDILIAKEDELTLTIDFKLHEVLPNLEELFFIDIFFPHITEPSGLKNLKRFIIEKGAAQCAMENLWLFEWYDAGKVEINSTVCFVVGQTQEGLHYLHISFSFANESLIHVLKYIKSTNEDCPPTCDCEIAGIQRYSVPIITVDCTSANLTQLPDLIPCHTTKLILNNNRITNISKIFSNTKYVKVNNILLQNNLIDHIDGELLCSYLKKHNLDVQIDLVNNKLETLPVKYLQKMYNEYDKKGHKTFPVFKLTGNPWNCDDCDFLPPFQNLIFHQYLQKDNSKEIRCGEGRYGAGQPIYKLPIRSYCKTDPPLKPLDILNICLGILLLLFTLNFLHNLVQYQRHGKLPWIVTKVPCC